MLSGRKGYSASTHNHQRCVNRAVHSAYRRYIDPAPVRATRGVSLQAVISSTPYAALSSLCYRLSALLPRRLASNSAICLTSFSLVTQTRTQTRTQTLQSFPAVGVSSVAHKREIRTQCLCNQKNTECGRHMMQWRE